VTLLVCTPAILLAAPEGDGHEKDDPLIPVTVWAIISFCIVLFILWKKLLPPILEAMDRRALEIRDSLAAAEKAKSEAEEMMQRHQADLDAARREAQTIIEEGKADAEKIKARIVADANSDAEEIAGRAVREIDLAKQAALQQLHLKSVEISFDIANQLIRKNLDPKDHEKLVEERLSQFESDN